LGRREYNIIRERSTAAERTAWEGAQQQWRTAREEHNSREADPGEV
jgi:hypothetical protein